MKKFKPPERPLLEVRRFFQWCQGMSLGILKRFREKNVQFFFRDFNSGANIQRLLLKRNGNSDLDVNLSLFFIELIGLSAQPSPAGDREAESVQSE